MNIFTELEIPYDELKRLGLTAEMVDDLPMPVMQRLLAGRETPPLPIKMTGENGEVQECLCGVLLKKTDGQVGVYLIPVWKEVDLSSFTQEEQDLLLRGDVLHYLHPSGKYYYAQYNDELKNLMMVEETIVRHNLEIINSNNDISQEDIDKIIKGNPTELHADPKNPVTVGINLKEWNALHITDGNEQAWRKEVAVKHNQYNFGMFGCWVCNPINGAFSYVPEEKYTEEMENEMKRIGQQRVSSQSMRGLKR